MHLDTLAHMAGAAAVSGLWQGALLAASVWLCLRLLSPANASLRFAVWSGVFLVVALLPLLESIFSDRLAPFGSDRPALLQVDARWSFGLATIWIAFSLTRAVSFAIQSYHLWTLHKQAVAVQPPPSLDMLSNVGRPVRLCTSTQLDRPGVIGLLSPRILIPDWLYPQLSAQELEQIVLHEVEHLRRHDDWLNLLQKLSLVLFPLNPVLIGIERLLCRERELACDDGVLRRTQSPRLYAACLATLAERGLDRRRLSLALGALGEQARQSELGRRVTRILQHRQAASALHARGLAAIIPLVLVCGVSVLARCPQLVSFAAPSPVVALHQTQPPMVQSKTPMYPAAMPSAARLVEASYTQPRGCSVPATHKKTRAVHKVRHASPARQKPVLVLSSWAEIEQPRFVTTPVSFTVVRVDGGWLFVQL